MKHIKIMRCISGLSRNEVGVHAQYPDSRWCKPSHLSGGDIAFTWSLCTTPRCSKSTFPPGSVLGITTVMTNTIAPFKAAGEQRRTDINCISTLSNLVAQPRGAVEVKGKCTDSECGLWLYPSLYLNQELLINCVTLDKWLHLSEPHFFSWARWEQLIVFSREGVNLGPH